MHADAERKEQFQAVQERPSLHSQLKLRHQQQLPFQNMVGEMWRVPTSCYTHLHSYKKLILHFLLKSTHNMTHEHELVLPAAAQESPPDPPVDKEYASHGHRNSTENAWESSGESNISSTMHSCPGPNNNNEIDYVAKVSPLIHGSCMAISVDVPL